MTDPRAASTPVLEILGLEKNYQALRPLRLQKLTVNAGERVAISGLDQPAAEVLVNLVTGAGLPDAGTVRVLGQSTGEITTGDAWLASLDRFGIVSQRAVLLEGATIEQNLAMPFTLQIDPVPADAAARVRALAAECGLLERSGTGEGWLRRPAGDAPPEIRVRAHLARAVALDPVLLLLEHPTATVGEAARTGLAEDVVRLAEARGLAVLLISEDQDFARRVAHQAWRLQPATGALAEWRRRWLW